MWLSWLDVIPERKKFNSQSGDTCRQATDGCFFPLSLPSPPVNNEWMKEKIPVIFMVLYWCTPWAMLHVPKSVVHRTTSIVQPIVCKNVWLSDEGQLGWETAFELNSVGIGISSFWLFIGNTFRDWFPKGKPMNSGFVIFLADKAQSLRCHQHTASIHVFLQALLCNAVTFSVLQR